MVPHIAERKTHQRLQEFSFDTSKRLLQQYRPQAEVVDLTQSPRRQLKVTARIVRGSQGFRRSQCRKCSAAA